jgi:hypothetical protein
MKFFTEFFDLFDETSFILDVFRDGSGIERQILHKIQSEGWTN